jgi:hypothetical protein
LEQNKKVRLDSVVGVQKLVDAFELLWHLSGIPIDLDASLLSQHLMMPAQGCSFVVADSLL